MPWPGCRSPSRGLFSSVSTDRDHTIFWAVALPFTAIGQFVADSFRSCRQHHRLPQERAAVEERWGGGGGAANDGDAATEAAGAEEEGG